MSLNSSLTNVTIYPTGQCNLACTYCFSRYTPWNAVDSNIEVMKSSVNFLIKESGNQENISISFFGGKPLIRVDLIEECCIYAKLEAEKYKKNVSFSITTNATLLNQDNLDIIKKYNIQLLISLDGLPHHTNQRVWKDKCGNSSATALSNTILALKQDIPITIRWTLHPKDLRYLSEDCITLTTIGLRNIALEFVYETEWSKEDLDLLKSELKKLSEYVIEEYRADRELFIKPFNDGFSLFKLEQRQTLRCGLGYFGVGISPDGTIQPCHRFVCRSDAEKWALGNVLTEFDKDKRDKMVSEWHYDKIKVDDGRLCKNCPVKLRCPGGICPPSHLDVNNDFYTVPHCYCDIQVICQSVANDIIGILYGERNPIIINLLK